MYFFLSIGYNVGILYLSLKATKAMNLSQNKSRFTLIIYLVFLQGILTLHCLGASYTASANGNWDNSSTWSSGRAPADNDTITIPSGTTVSLNVITLQYVSMKIIVNGVLHFNGGKKLHMCEGIIIVNSGGQLEADNSGSKVDICGNPAWDGADGGTGPLIISDPALPVELLSFTVTIINDNIQLNWATASETNSDYFSVERSDDLITFSEIGKVKGAGNSHVRQEYSFEDRQALSSCLYYRIKLVDFDGNVRFTGKTISIKDRSDDAAIVISPNPNNGRIFTLDLSAIKDKEVLISVIDNCGNSLWSQVMDLRAHGNNKFISVNTNTYFTTGIYSIRITGLSGQTCRRFCIARNEE